MQASTRTAPQAPVSTPSAPSATEMFNAARLVRSELQSQRDELVHLRRNLVAEVDRARNPVVQKGIEGRIVALDARIADVDKQLAAAETQLAQRAGAPGVILPPPVPYDSDIPPRVMMLSGVAMFMVVLLPVSIAFARRIWRRSAVPLASAPVPHELSEQIQNIERGVEAVAIEVERLGEGQRFVVQLMDAQNRRALGTAVPREGGES